jgi:hypothetical protein
MIALSGRPKVMLTLDAQVHAYERNHPDRPWFGTLHGPPEVTGDAMVTAMDAVGVDGALPVSPFSMYRMMPATHFRYTPLIPADSD